MELKVLVLNINEGYNKSIMDKCESLKGYSILVAKMRQYHKLFPAEEAIERAVNECIAEGILAEFLQKNRAEVLTVSIFEFDEEKYREVIRTDGFTEGRSIGLAEGRLQGVDEERENGIRLLIKACQNVNISRQKTLEQLTGQYSLDRDTALNYLNAHWN